MFRKSGALFLASLCGFAAALVFFLVGLVQTIQFSRWDPYLKFDWQRLIGSAQPSFPSDFFAHSFLGLVSFGALVFLLALATRLYELHPTSTVAGAGFLGLGFVVMAAYSVWLAFGNDLLLARYKSTQDEVLRQTFQQVYQAGILDLPVISGLLACFAIPGFLLLGNAFRGRTDKFIPVWPWCCVSAASLLFSVLALGYGYDRTFVAGRFPRTLMIWGQLGLWVLPTVTFGLCAAWLRWGATAAERLVAKAEPPMAMAA